MLLVDDDDGVAVIVTLLEWSNVRSQVRTLFFSFFTAVIFSFFSSFFPFFYFSFSAGLCSPSFLFFYFAEIGKKMGVGLGLGLDVGFGLECMGSDLGILCVDGGVLMMIEILGFCCCSVTGNVDKRVFGHWVWLQSKGIWRIWF